MTRASKTAPNPGPKHDPWQVTADAAQHYERIPARYILGPWTALLVDTAALAAGERVLDVACGTGLVARVAAQRVGTGGRVVGVDFNDGMIAVASSLPAPAGAAIEWHVRTAVDLQLPDASFDAVLCQQGLQFFPDKLVSLREMHRVLVRGGRLALSVWNKPGHYNTAVGEGLARFIGAAAAVKFCSSRQVPAREELQRLANEAGFAAVQVEVRRNEIHLPSLDRFVLDHLAGTPVAPFMAAADPAARQAMAASVTEQLARYADGDGVTYPEETHVLTARVQ